MSSMKDLLGDTPYPSVAFDGETYEPKKDYRRLKRQLDAVYELMKDGRWRTLAQIQAVVAGSEAAISARLRDLRKEQHGGFDVQRRRMMGGGLFEYCLRVSEGQR